MPLLNKNQGGLHANMRGQDKSYKSDGALLGRHLHATQREGLREPTKPNPKSKQILVASWLLVNQRCSGGEEGICQGKNKNHSTGKVLRHVMSEPCQLEIGKEEKKRHCWICHDGTCKDGVRTLEEQPALSYAPKKNKPQLMEESSLCPQLLASLVPRYLQKNFFSSFF